MRYFSPWDEFFLDPIVFDIWYIARHADVLADAVLADSHIVVGDSDHEEMLLSEGERNDPELKATLAAARRTPASGTAAANDGGVSKVRSTKVNFTLTSKSVSYLDYFHTFNNHSLVEKYDKYLFWTIVIAEKYVILFIVNILN